LLPSNELLTHQTRPMLEHSQLGASCMSALDEVGSPFENSPF